MLFHINKRGEDSEALFILNYGFELYPSHLIMRQSGHMLGVEFSESLC